MRMGAEDGDACFTLAGAYRGVVLVFIWGVLGVSESMSDAEVCRCDAGGTRVTGGGVGVVVRDKDDRGDSGVLLCIRARTLLLVASGAGHEGRRDRMKVSVAL